MNLGAVLRRERKKRKLTLKSGHLDLVALHPFTGFFNEVYAEWVGEHRPARTAVGVVSLPRGQVEVDLTVELT